jgi:hypothetical protein
MDSCCTLLAINNLTDGLSADPISLRKEGDLGDRESKEYGLDEKGLGGKRPYFVAPLVSRIDV